MGKPVGAILTGIVAEALFFRPRQLDPLSTCTTATFVPDSCIVEVTRLGRGKVVACSPNVP